MGSCHSVGPTLVQASAVGDTELVRRVLLKGPHFALYRSFKNKNTPILAAAGRGHREILRLLHLTALSSVGHSKTRKYLDVQNVAGYTPLMAACRNGHASCVRYLVLCDASPLPKEATHGRTCLHLAAQGSHNNCVVQLLASDRIADVKVKQSGKWISYVDTTDDHGMTPLHIAVRNGCISTVWCLLRWGASLDALTSAGKGNSLVPPGSNVLHIAAASGDTTMIKWLLEYQETHFPSVDLRQTENSAGQRPLACAEGSTLVGVLLEPSVPFSAITSLWRNRGLMQDREQWRKEAGIALHRVQLLLEACAIASSRGESTSLSSKILADVATLKKIVGAISAALPDVASSSTDANFRRSFTGSGAASLRSFQSIVEIASKAAKGCVGGVERGQTAEHLVLLTSLLEAVLTRVLQEKARKPSHRKHLSSFGSHGLASSSFRSLSMHSGSREEVLLGPVQSLLNTTNDMDEESEIPPSEKLSSWRCEGSSGDDQDEGCWQDQERECCAICMDRSEEIAINQCGHTMCLTCMVEMASHYTVKKSTHLKCPFCRETVTGFKALKPGQVCGACDAHHKHDVIPNDMSDLQTI